TYLSSSAGTISEGGSLTFTATVYGYGSTSPGGTVSFYEGGTALGRVSLTSYGGGAPSASFTTSTLGVGSHMITAVYSGDSNFQSSTSAAGTVTVTASAFSYDPTSQVLTING